MKTTSKLLFGLFTSAVLLAAPACDSKTNAGDDKKEEKAEVKADEAKVEEKKEEPAAEPAAEEPAAEPAADGDAAAADKIGIPECDEYFEKYLKCIDEKMPDAAKETTKKALQDSVTAWKAAAEGPGKETLAQTCKTAMDAAKKATEAMGCTW